MRGFTGLGLSLILFCGCSESKPATEPAVTDAPKPAAMLPPVEPDDEGAVQALEDLQAVFRRGGDGRITEVNLRGTAATDAALEHIAKLKGVTSLLLNDLPITDAGLAQLAAWKSPIVNLDLRGCSVGNAGLAHISEWTTLKAVRLNGASGKTTVDDDGLVHLTGLTRLKVLAFDGLWVSEDGLKLLADLKNVEELYLKSTLISDEGLAVLTQFPQLKKLRLAFNQISSDGLQQRLQ